MYEKVEKLFKGVNGYILGAVNLLLMTILTLYLITRFAAVWAIPPLTPYSVKLMGWPLVALALWIITAHTELGERKIGRIIAGLFVLFDVFFALETYVLSWIAKIGYWPIVHMDLSDMGISSTVGYGKSFMGVFALLVFGLMVFFIYQIFHNPSFWENYFSWHLEALKKLDIAKQRDKKLDIVVCVDKETGKEVVIPEGDLTTNTSIEGPTGSGKTSTILMTMIAQVLANPRAGATIIEPKGSGAKQAYGLAVKSGNPYARFINPENQDTDVFNPLEGDDPDIVAAVNEAMLSAMFGKQEAFFHLNQSAIIKNLILLLKYLRGNDLDYFDFDDLLLDANLCKNYLETLRKSLPDNEPIRSPRRRLIQWFDKEYFGENAEDIRKYTLGLRVHIQNLLSNKYFTRCIIGKTTIDMDKLLDEGGFLAVSTHDGKLKNLSKALGMVVLGHFQAAVERRELPIDKTDPNQQLRPHVLFVDELGTYANEEFGLFMTKAREYNVPLVLAFQQFSNLEAVSRELKKTVIGMCRSKIWFGDIPPEDAEWYSDLAGEYEQDDVSTSSGTSMGKTSWFMADSFKENTSVRKVMKAKFTYTDILNAPANHVFYRVMQNRTATPTNIGVVDWFSRKESSIGDVFWFDEKEFERRIEENKNGGVRKNVGFLGRLRGLLEQTEGVSLKERLGLQRNKPEGHKESVESLDSSIMASAEEIIKRTAVTRSPVQIKSDQTGVWITKEDVIRKTTVESNTQENETPEKQEREELDDNLSVPESRLPEIKEKKFNDELPPLKPISKGDWASSADDLL